MRPLPPRAIQLFLDRVNEWPSTQREIVFCVLLPQADGYRQRVQDLYINEIEALTHPSAWVGAARLFEAGEILRAISFAVRSTHASVTVSLLPSLKTLEKAPGCPQMIIEAAKRLRAEIEGVQR